MKIYEIIDEENNLNIGTLIYYEKIRRYIIELQSYLDEWTAPLLFANSVKNKQFTILNDLSFRWVAERIIPSSRQNINSILRQHKLSAYDENTFLELSSGKCSQDCLYIKKIDMLPEYVRKRAEKNVTECFITGQNELICFFANYVIKRVYLSKLDHSEDLEKVMRNPSLFNTVNIGVGGYSIIFDNSIEIRATDLYKYGTKLPISKNDFLSFLRNNIYDTSECSDVLNCSRQNISYMVREKSLDAVKENAKGNLFLKGNVYNYTWD